MDVACCVIEKYVAALGAFEENNKQRECSEDLVRNSTSRKQLLVEF